MTQLTLNLFGAVELSHLDNPAKTRFRSDKVRALLAYLSLEAARPHERRSLAGLFWPELPEQASLRNLRKALFYLRQSVEELSPESSNTLLIVDHKTVQLQRNNLMVDAVQFEQLLSTVEQHAHRQLHLCQDCLERLAQADQLYQGELMAGFSLRDVAAFEEWLLFWRERLHQRVIFALGHLTAAYMKRNEYDRALDYATRQVGLDRFREEAHRQLMQLLSLSGQHNQAMAQYESCRRVLRDELDVEPAAETTALYQQIVAVQRGEVILEEDRKTAVLHQFPTQFTPFIGREQELQQINERFLDPECRLLTLVGPGGMGKTRLSIRVAELLANNDDFIDGIYFFPLAEVDNSNGLLMTLIAGLDVALSGQLDPKARLFEFLRERNYLFVLDNFEQLVQSAPVLTEMLAAAPNLRLLVSSHVPLQLRAEKRFNVSGLSYPAADEVVADLTAYSAIRLFAESAMYANAAFKLNKENEKFVWQICQFVRGMPLAIELAAAWVSVMDCEAIVYEINRSLDFLSLTPQDRPSRHQSMTAVFDYTWQLLEAAEKNVLKQLAIFHGPFTLHAATAITEATPLTIARLLDKSLLQRRKDGRYELHQLLRQFIGQQVEAPDKQVAQKYCDFYMHLVAEQADAFLGPQPRQAIVALRHELANIRHAWQWALEQEYWAAVKISMDGLGRFYQTATLIHEGEAVFKDACQTLKDSHTENREVIILLQTWHAFFLHKLGRHGEAIQLLNQALERADGNKALQAKLYSMLGQVLPVDGKSAQAILYLEKAITYYRTVSKLQELAQALRRMIIACLRGGKHGEALRYSQEAIPLHQALNYKPGLAQLNNMMAGLYFEQDNPAQALTYIEQARKLYEEIDDKMDTVIVAGNLATVYSRLGQFEKALGATQQAIDLSHEMGDRHSLARNLSNRGKILSTIGAFEGSLDCYFRALEIEETLGNAARIAHFQAGIAVVYQMKGDEETALSYYDLALPVLASQANPFHLVGPLLNKTELLIQQGEWSQAQELNERASKLATEMGFPEYIHRGHILTARLAFATGNKVASQQQLIDLLANTEDEIEQAELNYELWQMTQDKASAEAAFEAYKQACKHVPSFINKLRRNELESVLVLKQ
jgi:predicted ATPase/DNA-binding SARP family transcriptional activator